MSEDTSMRDELARERTVLANERTLLAYGRTALGLFGVAIVLFKFDQSSMGTIGALFAVTAAICVWIWGMRTYRQVAARINNANLTPQVQEELAVIAED